MLLLILLLLQSLNLVILLLLLVLRRRVGAYSTPRASGDWYSPRTQTLRPEDDTEVYMDFIFWTIQTMQRQSGENWNHLKSAAWTNRARPLAR
jgi:hypothetical protein